MKDFSEYFIIISIISTIQVLKNVIQCEYKLLKISNFQIELEIVYFLCYFKCIVLLKVWLWYAFLFVWLWLHYILKYTKQISRLCAKYEATFVATIFDFLILLKHEK